MVQTDRDIYDALRARTEPNLALLAFGLYYYNKIDWQLSREQDGEVVLADDEVAFIKTYTEARLTDLVNDTSNFFERATRAYVEAIEPSIRERIRNEEIVSALNDVRGEIRGWFKPVLAGVAGALLYSLVAFGASWLDRNDMLGDIFGKSPPVSERPEKTIPE